MNSAAHYRVNEDELSFRVLDGEAVIISTGTGYYYSLNRTGTVLWNLLLDGGRDAGDAARRLAAYYAVDVAAISADVEQALTTLLAEKLIGEAEAPAVATGDGFSAAPAAANGNGYPDATADHPYEQPQLVKFDRLQRLMVCGE